MSAVAAAGYYYTIIHYYCYYFCVADVQLVVMLMKKHVRCS